MMKPLLCSTAILAALAIAGPTWAQTTPPSTMTPSGTPTTAQPAPSAQTAPGVRAGPTYSQPTTVAPQAGTYPQQPAPQSGSYMQQPTTAQTMPMQPAGVASGTTGEQATEAMPMRHHASRGRHARRHGHHMSASAARRGGQMNDNVAEQLNREEASRISSGTSMAPTGAQPAPNTAGQPQPAPTQMR